MALSPLLCNKSSIIRNYLFNHTLQEVIFNESFLPDDLASLLKISKKIIKVDAALGKIINCHFSAMFSMQPFLNMELNILPHALAWMCRDDISNSRSGRRGNETSGSSFPYQLVRAAQALSNFTGKIEKIKRE